MTAAVIDQAVLQALRDATGPDFVRELAGTFLEEAPLMLGDLRESLAAKDAERFRRAAHSLKSNALTFGATAMATQAKALELGGLPADAAPVDALDMEFARVAAALGSLPDA